MNFLPISRCWRRNPPCIPSRSGRRASAGTCSALPEASGMRCRLAAATDLVAACAGIYWASGCFTSVFGEIDRPSWSTRFTPHWQTPITRPAARLPFVATCASVTQIPCRHGTLTIPYQMPDIRLQAHPQQPNYRSVSCGCGGVHIRRVRPLREHGDLTLSAENNRK